LAEITPVVERTVSTSGAEPLLLFGFNDVYLRKIESAFPETRIVARGDELRLRGPADQADRIERVVGELILILSRTANLTETDVETVLEIARAGGAPRRSAATDAILFTPQGGTVKAKTPGQGRLVESARLNDIVFAVGPAGTGKTYVSVALAVSALKSRQVKKIVLARPAVEAGESLGFLPGGFRDKVDPYLRPLYDALEDMIERDKLQSYLERNIIEIVPLAYMRGRTLTSAFVILDEAQNATASQMKMFLTRLGAGSRAIVTGDGTQTDLPSRTLSGLTQARDILEGVDGIDFVDFDKGDVVRHKLVKDIIEAYEKAADLVEEPGRRL
jgi:phosphate starvation-inducible PhoH-like protein